MPPWSASFARPSARSNACARISHRPVRRTRKTPSPTRRFPRTMRLLPLQPQPGVPRKPMRRDSRCEQRRGLLVVLRPQLISRSRHQPRVRRRREEQRQRPNVHCLPRQRALIVAEQRPRPLAKRALRPAKRMPRAARPQPRPLDGRTGQ